MVATYVLIIGVMLVLVVGGIGLVAMGNGHILPSLVPLAPLLVAIGCILLIMTELLLFFGNKEDKKCAFRDLGYLIPTLFISSGLWWVAQRFLW
ncbi:MAG: hypothetical protein ABFD49_02970 [Armatimonadota bacterium]|nr:hypothetical protein [bacterium]